MPSKTVQIVNMIADEDDRVVENALQQMPGVEQVDIHSPSKHVTIAWRDPATWTLIERTLSELGYAARDFVNDDDEDDA